jgi:hypothetical protein
VDRLLELLTRAGVVVQHNVTHEQRERFGEDRVGGTVELTPFGMLVAVDAVRRAGFYVQEAPDPGRLTTEELSRLAVDELLTPDDWLELVDEWSAGRDDRLDALEELLGVLHDDDALLAVLLVPPPEPLADDLATVMQRLVAKAPPPDPLGSAAATWLLQNGRIDVETMSQEHRVEASLVALSMVARSDPELVPEVLSEGRSQADQLEVVAGIGRRTSAHMVEVLDAIGQHHEDKVVRKAARKELFRVRSRLASRANHPPE